MDITPSTHLLESIRSQRGFGWKEFFAELIDNPFDADAKNVTIDLEPNLIRVSDDGVGCADLRVMFSPGEHRSHGGIPGIGRFGIGFKDSALFVWGLVTVESVHGKRRSIAKADWDQVTRSSHWSIADPIVQPSDGQAPGTVITFRHLRRHIPVGKDLESLIRQIEYLFAPALRSGRTITFRQAKKTPIIAKQFEWPPCDVVHTDQIEVQGRAAHIRVGIVSEGNSNPHAGLSYIFRHRVIVPSSNLGCGEYNTRRVFGWVELENEDWHLAKNKNDIVELKEELAKAVEESCRPLLEKAGKQAHYIALNDLSSRITHMLRNTISYTTRKAKRDKSNDPGLGDHGTGNGERKHKKARKTQPGSTILDRVSPGIRVDFFDLESEDGIGYVDEAGDLIKVSEKHPYVRWMLTTFKTEVQDAVLAQLAFSILSEHLVRNESTQKMLPFMESAAENRKFSMGLAKMLESINTTSVAESTAA